MTAERLEQLERLLHAVAALRFGAAALRERELSAAIVAVSSRYNRPGAAATAAWSDAELAARLTFFTVADLPKIAFPVAELQRRRGLRDGPLRVLDVGAGFGAQTLGLALQLAAAAPHRAELEAVAVDADPRCLEAMQAVFARCAAETTWGSAIRLRCRVADLRAAGALARAVAADGRQADYDLILAGALLAELPEERHAALTAELLALLAPDGALVLVEPALREQARALHRLRDQLLATNAAEVFAPCPHREPCPALCTPTDWCHELREWQPPPLLRRLATATGLRRRDLKWAHLTLRRIAAPLAAEGQQRVVSAPLRSKGKTEIFLCSAAGRRRTTRLKRHTSAANAEFADLDRGQLVRLEGAEPRAEQLRVVGATGVTREDPAAGAWVSGSAEPGPD